jgi:hypothetical protein
MQATIRFEDITYIFSIKSAEYNFCNEDGHRFLMFRFCNDSEIPITIPNGSEQSNFSMSFQVLFPADSMDENDLIAGKVFYREDCYDAELHEWYANFYMNANSEITNIRVEILEKIDSQLHCRAGVTDK